MFRAGGARRGFVLDDADDTRRLHTQKAEKPQCASAAATRVDDW
jgi:hypothetical protein